MAKVIGTLVAVVHKARQLNKLANVGMQSIYCTVSLGDNVQKTLVDPRGGQTPSFGSEHRFMLCEGSPDLLIQVFSGDYSKPQLIGETRINVDKIVEQGEWNGERYAGEVFIKFALYCQNAPSRSISQPISTTHLPPPLSNTLLHSSPSASPPIPNKPPDIPTISTHNDTVVVWNGSELVPYSPPHSLTSTRISPVYSHKDTIVTWKPTTESPIGINTSRHSPRPLLGMSPTFPRSSYVPSLSSSKQHVAPPFSFPESPHPPFSHSVSRPPFCWTIPENPLHSSNTRANFPRHTGGNLGRPSASDSIQTERASFCMSPNEIATRDRNHFPIPTLRYQTRSSQPSSPSPRHHATSWSPLPSNHSIPHWNEYCLPQFIGSPSQMYRPYFPPSYEDNQYHMRPAHESTGPEPLSSSVRPLSSPCSPKPIAAIAFPEPQLDSTFSTSAQECDLQHHFEPPPPQVPRRKRSKTELNQ
ncbi:uncharacterized protein VTP21DRAFT_11229 [Calcarisporiella thermophila]|uniref:uncharacterized protein n=1 Tax=Calcarisporiella thermophila TaxID=911321 RepID=UPI003742023B